MNGLKEKKQHPILSYPGMDKDRQEETSLQYSSKSKMPTWKKVAIVSASFLSVIVLALLTIIIINLQSQSIFSNIFIDGIEVSGLSKEAAIEKINNEKSAILAQKFTLACQDINLDVSGNDISIQYSVDEAVDKAFVIGRYGNIFSNNLGMINSWFNSTEISCDYAYDEEKLDNLIASMAEQLPQLEQSGYTIENKNLIITKGKAGLSIDKDLVKAAIIKAFKSGEQSHIQISPIEATPEIIDINKIHEEVFKEPVNATYKMDPFEVIPHQDGVDFEISLEDATNLLAEDKDVYSIPLVFTTPDITTDKIGTEAFPDLLASFSTTYIQSKINRTTNLKVASNSVNGVVILPGETFSYNKTLGPRTVEAGYKMAGMYSGGEEVEGLGGGICQVSSTLYNIVLMANMDIVERHNHQFLPGYVGAGRDATVVYGSLDFKFKNTRNYPVKIQSSVGNGYVTMKLYGVKEASDYQVDFSTTILSTIYPQETYENTNTLPAGQTQVKDSGQNGCKSITYKILKRDGKEVSRVQLSADTYSAKKKVILRGVAQAAPEPTPSTPTVAEPTESQEPTTTPEETPSVDTPSSADITIEI